MALKSEDEIKSLISDIKAFDEEIDVHMLYKSFVGLNIVLIGVAVISMDALLYVRSFSRLWVSFLLFLDIADHKTSSPAFSTENIVILNFSPCRQRISSGHIGCDRLDVRFW